MGEIRIWDRQNQFWDKQKLVIRCTKSSLEIGKTGFWGGQSRKIIVRLDKKQKPGLEMPKKKNGSEVDKNGFGIAKNWF